MFQQKKTLNSDAQLAWCNRSCILKVVNWLAKASAVGIVVMTGCQVQSAPRMYHNTQVLMGTYVEVSSDDKRAAHIVFGEFKRLEDLLSKYNPKSEVSALNRDRKASVGPDLYYLLTRAKEFWFATDGAFDITVGPLMDLWGFTAKKYRQPSDEEIRKTRQLIGANKIIFHPSNNVVEFNIPEMKIDLGAIGKGYAVDCSVKALRAAGVKRCLINAGGQIYALGAKGGKPWRVAIQDPRGNTALSDYIELADQSASTSGDYEQYFTAGNKRYSHIMDPQTGYPADSGVISATVIAPDGLTADFLSTSIVVMGKDKAMALIERFPGVSVKIIDK
jgi:FAD:protein FMN transferase